MQDDCHCTVRSKHRILVAGQDIDAFDLHRRTLLTHTVVVEVTGDRTVIAGHLKILAARFARSEMLLEDLIQFVGMQESFDQVINQKLPIGIVAGVPGSTSTCPLP